MKRILLVEDDRTLSNGILLTLRNDSMAVTQAYTLQAARELAAHETYDLFILDINLPDGSGLDYLQELRGAGGTPIILLTANDMETDVVAGLEMGADDYVTKPFSLAVFRARVNNQLRRKEQLVSGLFTLDDFRFDFERMEFRRKERLIELSKTEQKLLRLLVSNRGITLARADLVDRIWTDGAEFVEENALSVTIKRLRDKLETTPSKPQYIRTVYGIGYTWRVGES